MYATMMTSAFILHSVFTVECGQAVPPNQVKLYYIVSIADATLTSSIAISFMFNGLVDMEWVSEKNKFAWFVMIVIDGAIMVGYMSGNKDLIKKKRRKRKEGKKKKEKKIRKGERVVT